MTEPHTILIMMLIILMSNMMTKKTSIMCINLTIYVTLMSVLISMKMKMSPMPFIIFLTMIGGLMIIFLYLASTLWAKKETLTLNLKILGALNLLMPMTSFMKLNSPNMNNTLNLFDYNFNKLTIILIILLAIILMFTIEIHMKANSPFRRKLKIWNKKKNF